MIVLGIDPGFNPKEPGALAVFNGRLQKVEDMPLSGGELDAAILADLIEALGKSAYPTYNAPHVVIVERPQKMPGMASGHSKLMEGYGVIKGILAALDWRMEAVTPSKWKSLTATPRDKDGARLRASQLMPDGAKLWPLKKHHGRAEAALLAWWGAQF